MRSIGDKNVGDPRGPKMKRTPKLRRTPFFSKTSVHFAAIPNYGLPGIHAILNYGGMGVHAILNYGGMGVHRYMFII